MKDLACLTLAYSDESWLHVQYTTNSHSSLIPFSLTCKLVGWMHFLSVYFQSLRSFKSVTPWMHIWPWWQYCKFFANFQSKKMYEKASSEAEQALLAYQKADQDMANSRLTIEKVCGTMCANRTWIVYAHWPKYHIMHWQLHYCWSLSVY